MPIVGTAPVVISWTAPAQVPDGYNVYRAEGPGYVWDTRPLNGIVPIQTTTLTDPTIELGVSYRYAVTAITSGYESVPILIEVSASPKPTAGVLVSL